MRMSIQHFITYNTDETEQVGFSLATKLAPGAVVALFGDLGAGKTAFVRGLAKGLGVTKHVCSPTYALVHDYGKLIHFDMYRIAGPGDLESTGWYDYLYQTSVLAVEWSEHILKELPAEAVCVTITAGNNDNERRICIDYPGS